VLDALLDRKGVVSRQIGEAKRSGLAIDGLLDDMKLISAEIKRLRNDSKPKSPSKLAEDVGISKPPLFEMGAVDSHIDHSHISVTHAVDESERKGWDDYVRSKSNSSIYHLWTFKKIIESAFGHDPHYLLAKNQSGSIVGVLPAVEMKSRLFGHFIISQPFFTYGAALFDHESVEKKLIEALIDYARSENVEHIELRSTSPLAALDEKLLSKENKVSMVRSLPESSETLWTEIGSKVRAQVKKAQRYPLEMKFGQSELLNDYYAVFSENMRDLGTPVYAKRFFSEILNSDLSDAFTIGVVYYDGKPVACCFLLSYQKMMEIPWASTLKSANHMNVNMFMYWAVLQKAISQKQQFFDFGRSSKGAGTYRFKKQWGALPQQLYWNYWLPGGGELPELNPNNPKYKLLIGVWQKMPVWLTQIVGPLVVKYLP